MAPADQPRDDVAARLDRPGVSAVGSRSRSRPAGLVFPGRGPAPVLSNYEKNGNTIRRDCGYSSPLPGKPGWSLWLFCDTVIASLPGGKTERLILGTDTAAAGPYRAGHAPSRLSEIPTPPAPLTLPDAGAPQPFLPEPQHLLRPGSTFPCTGPGAYPASWISGVAREPAADAASHLLISYDSYCVTGNPDALTAEGFGLIEYDPARNLLSWPAAVFTSLPGLQLPPQQVLGSPVFPGDGYLYLFSFCPAAPPPAGCGHGSVFAVRTVAQPAYWQNPFTYQYWTGSGWSPDGADAHSLMPARHPFGISVGDYSADGHGLVMVEQTSLAGAFVGVAGQVARRPVAADHHRPGAVRRGLPARNAEPVPGRHRPSGTQYPRPAAHFLFRSGRSSRGGVRLSLVIPHPCGALAMTLRITHSRPAS